MAARPASTECVQFARSFRPQAPVAGDPQRQRDVRLRRQRRQLTQNGYADEQMETLFRREKDAALRVLAAEPHAGKVGAFEGAGYHAEGLYRPALDCIMFSRNTRTFCPVCARAIEQIIDLHCE